jgi:hypothetical protein
LLRSELLEGEASLSSTWSRTTLLTQISPGSPVPAARAATFTTPVAKDIVAVDDDVATLMPIRNSIR